MSKGRRTPWKSGYGEKEQAAAEQRIAKRERLESIDYAGGYRLLNAMDMDKWVAQVHTDRERYYELNPGAASNLTSVRLRSKRT